MGGLSLANCLLIFFLGPLHGQLSAQETSKPLCTIAVAAPCINAAIASYVRNTQGAEAAAQPTDPQIIQLVALTMTSHLYHPERDINATCDVLQNIDTSAMVRCLEKASTGCSFQPPASLQSTTLPSLAVYTMMDVHHLTRRLCSTECTEFPMVGNVGTMKQCWKTYGDGIVDVDQRNLNTSSEICNLTETYMHCQWNNSIGCSFLEFSTRNYMRTFDQTLKTCDLTIIPTVPVTAVTNKGTTLAAKSSFSVAIYILMFSLPSTLLITKDIRQT